MHIRDAYAPGGRGGGDGGRGVDWWLCAGGLARRTASIRSYLHVLTVTQAGGTAPRRRRRQRRRPAPSAAAPELPEMTISFSAAPGEPAAAVACAGCCRRQTVGSAEHWMAVSGQSAVIINTTPWLQRLNARNAAISNRLYALILLICVTDETCVLLHSTFKY